ncbi:MAG: hypothetical protein E7H33_09555 [Clostridium perfringens]|nr:hypothetical protein [Clostridium perfringens]
MLEIIKENSRVKVGNLKEDIVYENQYGHFIRKENKIYQCFSKYFREDEIEIVCEEKIKLLNFEKCSDNVEDIYFLSLNGLKHMSKKQYFENEECSFKVYYEGQESLVRLIEVLDLNTYKEKEEKLTKLDLLHMISDKKIDMSMSIYNEFKGARFVGYYDNNEFKYLKKEDFEEIIVAFLISNNSSIEFLLEKLTSNGRPYNYILALEENDDRFLSVVVKPRSMVNYKQLENVCNNDARIRFLANAVSRDLVINLKPINGTGRLNLTIEKVCENKDLIGIKMIENIFINFDIQSEIVEDGFKKLEVEVIERGDSDNISCVSSLIELTAEGKKFYFEAIDRTLNVIKE